MHEWYQDLSWSIRCMIFLFFWNRRIPDKRDRTHFLTSRMNPNCFLLQMPQAAPAFRILGVNVLSCFHMPHAVSASGILADHTLDFLMCKWSIEDQVTLIVLVTELKRKFSNFHSFQIFFKTIMHFVKKILVLFHDSIPIIIWTTFCNKNKETWVKVIFYWKYMTLTQDVDTSEVWTHVPR